MEEVKRKRLERFMSDEMTALEVYNYFRDSFLRKRGSRDVQQLAAERLSVDLLEEAWKELKGLQFQSNETSGESKQVGL